jgi:exoribonuclease II
MARTVRMEIVPVATILSLRNRNGCTLIQYLNTSVMEFLKSEAKFRYLGVTDWLMEQNPWEANSLKEAQFIKKENDSQKSKLHSPRR